MTLPEFYDRMEYWREWPPTHIVAAIAAGYKPPAHPASSKEDVMRVLNKYGGAGRGKAGNSVPSVARTIKAQ